MEIIVIIIGDMMDSLNEYSNLLIFLVTSVYAIVSWRMWKEMERSRLDHKEPNVSLRLIQRKSTDYEIEIVNCSNVEVYNLSFKFNNPDFKVNPKTINDIGYFKNNISYLGIGQTYRNQFLSGIKSTNNKAIHKNPYINFDLTYFGSNPKKNKKAKLTKKSIQIDLRMLENTCASPLFEVAAIEQFKQLNGKIAEVSEKMNMNKPPSAITAYLRPK